MNNEMTTDNMSNEEVIEVLKGIVFNSFDRTTPKERQALHLAIKSLKERPQGEWKFKKFDEKTGIPNSDWCPFCGMVKAQVYDNFCGNCGADMRGETNA